MNKLICRIDSALKWTLAGLMLSIVLVVCWQVVSRYLLNAPSSITEELSRCLLIWIGMKIKKIYLPVIITTALAVGVLIGGYLNFSAPTANFSSNASKNKLNKLLDFINNEYVDEVNTDSIVDITVNGILEKLDPHSVYIAKNEILGVYLKRFLPKYLHKLVVKSKVR